MAAILSPACYPADSWYGFTYPLAWSENCQVAEILSDIPFVSVGVLVLCIFVLFIFLSRVSLSAVWLFFSALLAFVAAVLDLGQTLANQGMTTTTSVVGNPAIRAREVFLAFSVGFRLLFYWSYVGEPPLKARYAPATQKAQRIGFLTLEHAEGPCGGTWLRHGLPGKLLGISLSVAIIIITVLQIVWRVDPLFHQYSNVYAADVALELLVAFLLLLKLLLNTVTQGSQNNISVHTFRECLAPISALLVNIVIGVGDLLYFAFTESTVGRLLQAFEVYIIVVFVMVTALLRHRNTLLSTVPPQGNTCVDVMFTLPEPSRVSIFRVTPPVIETPRMSMVLGAATQSKESTRDLLRRSARRSLNHVSSWLSSRVSRSRPRKEDEEVKLWNAEDAKVDPPYTGSVHTQLRDSIVSLTQEPKEWVESLRSSPAKQIAITPALDTQSAIAQSTKGSVHDGQIVPPHRGDTGRSMAPLKFRTSFIPVSSVPVTTSSGAKEAGSIETPPEASPVYGLGGIRPPASDPDSRTSLDKLLKQQKQLDQSIEALKLFSTRTSINSYSSGSVLNHKSVELSRSPSTGQRTVCSDVSLSSFPIPPWSTTPLPTVHSPHTSSMLRIRGDRRVRLAAARTTPVQDTDPLVPHNISASLVDIPSSSRCSSVLHSPLGEENESLPAKPRKPTPFDTGGTGETRYNVTSFIGGLATPDEPGRGSREVPWCLTENVADVGAIQTSSGMKKPLPLPPRLLPTPPRIGGLPASPAAAKLSPLSRSSRLSQGVVIDEFATAMSHHINDHRSRSLMTAPSSQTLVTDPAKKGTFMPTRPQPACRLAGSSGGVGRGQKIFVRPRPPPLALQSYGAPRVQVLTDE